MASPPRAEPVVALVALVVLLLPAPPAAARTIYCCDDASGRPMCGDQLPTTCYGRAYREIGPQGTVRKQIAAPLSSDEVARRNAEIERRKQDEVRLLKQRRLDQALLETYQSLADLDSREQRAIGELERDIGQGSAREAELVAERAPLAKQAEGFRAGELPRKLEASLQRVDAELAAQRKILESKRRELDTVRARFASDRRRYVELTSGGDVRR